jgi:hypothetical protein
MKIKKVVIFLAILMLVLNQSIPVFAETIPIVNQSNIWRYISPMWDNTSSLKLNLYFTGDNAECVGIIKGVSGTSNISTTFILERKGLFGWTLENSWTENVNGESLSFYRIKTVTKGTYRLSVTAKITVDGVTETVNASVQEKY